MSDYWEKLPEDETERKAVLDQRSLDMIADLGLTTKYNDVGEASATSSRPKIIYILPNGEVWL